MKGTMIFGAAATLALAGCATAPHNTSVTANGPATGASSQHTMVSKPATDTANKPRSGLVNSGGGLSQNMTADEAVRAFRTMDSNADGYVDRSEFTNYGDSGQRFPGCDTNGDGKLTQAEYVACSQRPASADPGQ